MLDVPLNSRRLIAREFALSDFEAVHAYGSDAEVTRFMFDGRAAAPRRRTTSIG